MKNKFFLILFLIFISLSFLFPSLVFAKNNYVILPEEFQKATEGNDANLSNFTLGVVSNLENFIITAIAGTPVQTGTNPQSGQPIYSYQGGAIEIVGNLTVSLYTHKPASSIEYLADLGSNLGLVKPAYAQGLGFSAFSPVLSLWKAFRDIAYLAFVIIFVIIGFMIMFRKKIDPRTVVTVQDSLPRIIITLLLVTFSYAIAGLVIDSGDLLTRLIGSTLNKSELIALKSSDPSKQPQDLLNALYSNNIFELVNPLRDVDKLVKNLKESDIPLASDLPLGLGGVTAWAIFAVAGIFIMFKIFFALIGPYVSIILSVIFAPFILLLGALPGSNNSLSSWLRGLLSKVLVFPITFAMLAIAAAIKGYTVYRRTFGGNAEWGVTGGGFTIGWSPATIGNWGGVVGDLVAFGILFTIPQVIQIVQSALQIKPQPWEAAPGAEIKSAAAKLPIIRYFAGQLP